MVIFLAIMLHKAPASFGLVTFLLHEKLERPKIRKHLISFALSAPIGAFITFFVLKHFPAGSIADVNATGKSFFSFIILDSWVHKCLEK